MSVRISQMQYTHEESQTRLRCHVGHWTCGVVGFDAVVSRAKPARRRGALPPLTESTVVRRCLCSKSAKLELLLLAKPCMRCVTNHRHAEVTGRRSCMLQVTTHSYMLAATSLCLVPNRHWAKRARTSIGMWHNSCPQSQRCKPTAQIHCGMLVTTLDSASRLSREIGLGDID